MWYEGNVKVRQCSLSPQHALWVRRRLSSSFSPALIKVHPGLVIVAHTTGFPGWSAMKIPARFAKVTRLDILWGPQAGQVWYALQVVSDFAEAVKLGGNLANDVSPCSICQRQPADVDLVCAMRAAHWTAVISAAALPWSTLSIAAEWSSSQIFFYNNCQKEFSQLPPVQLALHAWHLIKISTALMFLQTDTFC